MRIWQFLLVVIISYLCLPPTVDGQLFKKLFGKLYGKISKNERPQGKHQQQQRGPEVHSLMIDDQEGFYSDFVKNVLPLLSTPAPVNFVQNSPPAAEKKAPVVNLRGPIGSNGLPIPPYIRLGGNAPPEFRVVNNFKESFEVRLPPIVSRSPNKPYPWEKTVKNLGSIMSQSKIYISPEYPVFAQPPINTASNVVKAPSFSDSEAIVRLFNGVSDIMRDKVKQVASKYEYRSFQEDTERNSGGNIDPSQIERPVVIVHLQSYTALSPNLTGVDWDVAQAQNAYGFGAGAFEFGKTDTVGHILKSLSQSNIEDIDINELGGSQDEINENVFSRFNQFVNSTRKVHLWAHTRSEVDAAKRFRLPFLEGGHMDNAIPKNFQDTAPLTDTLAVAFL